MPKVSIIFFYFFCCFFLDQIFVLDRNRSGKEVALALGWFVLSKVKEQTYTVINFAICDVFTSNGQPPSHPTTSFNKNDIYKKSLQEKQIKRDNR